MYDTQQRLAQHGTELINRLEALTPAQRRSPEVQLLILECRLKIRRIRQKINHTRRVWQEYHKNVAHAR